MRMKRAKKILLIIGIVLTIFVITVVLVFRSFQDYSVDMRDAAAVPESEGTLPPVRPDSFGWPSWKGRSHNNHSAFTDIITDWSGGPELLWSVDYLCKGRQSITWSRPVIAQGNLYLRYVNRLYCYRLAQS
jgi:hypothetical protein